MGVKLALGVMVSSQKQLALNPSKLRQLDLRLPVLGAGLLRTGKCRLFSQRSSWPF